MAFLLKCNGINTKTTAKVSHCKIIGVTAIQTNHVTTDNMMTLRKILKEQGANYILQLNRNQLRHLKPLLFNVNSSIDDVYRKQGCPFTSPDFQKALSQLESCLRQALGSFRFLDRKKASAEIQVLTLKEAKKNNPATAGRYILKTKTAQSLQHIQGKSGNAWIAICLTEYLSALNRVVVGYGYGDVPMFSIINYIYRSYLKD